jgi:prophage maintenance system killer protein
MFVDYICKINSSLCNENNVRDIDSLELISKYYEYALNDEENFLCSSMKVAALIKLFQPFHDGNHRTAIIVFGDLLNTKGYEFDCESALFDMNNHKLNLPTLYSEDDEITNISRFEKYILNKPKSL